MMTSESYYPQEAARFAKDTAEHVITILHDDGLYRHLRFKKPGTSFYWFDLVTWPGYLTIAGDMGTFTFERVEDMFTFFRASSDINPQYWSEKIRAGAGTNGAIATEFSETLFRQHVNEALQEYLEDADLEQAQKDALIERVRAEILIHGESAFEAHEALRDFEQSGQRGPFWDTWEWDFFDYTVQFLWCCFAIRWGISQFDAKD